MKSFKLAILSLLLVSGLPLLCSQDVTKPIIPAPPPATATEPPAKTPATAPAATPGQTPAPASAASSVPSNYVIGPGDELLVTVFKDPTVSGEVLVRSDGMISLNLLGDVKAVDFTPLQLADDLATRFRKFIIDAEVTVTVRASNSKFIFFAGEIHIGKLPYLPSLTPLQAIIENGGPTAYANQKNIYILRTVKGKQVKIPFNYKKAVKTGDQQGVTLLPGDTIVVP